MNILQKPWRHQILLNGSQITDLLNDQLTAIPKKFQNHPIIMKLKGKYNFQDKFSFKSVPVKYVYH